MSLYYIFITSVALGNKPTMAGYRLGSFPPILSRKYAPNTLSAKYVNTHIDMGGLWTKGKNYGAYQARVNGSNNILSTNTRYQK